MSVSSNYIFQAGNHDVLDFSGSPILVEKSFCHGIHMHFDVEMMTPPYTLALYYLPAPYFFILTHI